MLTFLTATACLVALLYKAALITRLNVNWDEFFYLSFVHELSRGELTLVLQGAFTHLFGWLPAVAENEVDQVVAARFVMVVLLALTSWLIWQLAQRWLRGFSAAAPVLVYLSFVPVTVHGGSFRADSMLTPLLMAVLVVLAENAGSRRRQAMAGFLLGAALALTIKAALFVPMVAAFLCFMLREQADYAGGRARWQAWMTSLVVVGTIAGLSAAALIGTHAMSLAEIQPNLPSAVAAESVRDFAVRTATTTLLETPWFPMGNVFRLYVGWQPALWLLMAIGFIATIAGRRYAASALALALLPIALYRNSFPYFYVVMLAPPSVLAGFALQPMLDYLAKQRMRFAYAAFALVVLAGLVYQPLTNFRRLWVDNQSVQREVVAGVHRIFPEPANYIDRCGMIGSFRKVNFFMSTWGVAQYRAAARPVMHEIAAQAKPAFLLMNTAVLKTSRPSAHGLLEPDREFLQDSYTRYWGPIKVAGGATLLTAGQTGRIRVPFAGEYRIVAPVPVVLGGRLHQPGDVISAADTVSVRLDPAVDLQVPIAVKLVLAKAQPPPANEPPPQDLFTGL